MRPRTRSRRAATGLVAALALLVTVVPPVGAAKGDAVATDPLPTTNPVVERIVRGWSPWLANALLARLPYLGLDAEPAGPRHVDLGRDGRLTVLLLGSDYRPNLGGERMDVMIVMSLDPATGRVVAASIPRDMIFFPRARANGGVSSGLTRVNALVEYYRKDGLAHGKVDRRAFERFRADVQTALRVEIDYWAMTRFKGFAALINRLKGIRLDITEAVDDPYYRRGGAYFPEAANYRLRGSVRCQQPKACHSALTYVRSRKGTVGGRVNSDFARSRRQQEVVMAAIQRVVRMKDTDRIAALIGASRGKAWTDLPRTLPAALELMGLLSGATLASRDMAVLGPSIFAYEDDETPIYTFRPNLPVIRGWLDDHLGTPARR